MRTPIVAASLLLAGFVAVGPVAASTPQKSKATPTATARKVQSAWASGTLEKFDPVAHTLVLKHGGKDQAFTLGEHTSVMRGKEKGAVPDLASTVGKPVKVEYTMANGARTVSLVEISAGAERPAAGAVRK